jgi:ATP-dependent Clp protease ATP-binding subunit ClpC
MVWDLYSQFKRSSIFEAVQIEKSLLFRFRKFEKKIYLGFVFVFLILYLYSNFNKKFFSFCLISLSFYLSAFLRDLFFEDYYKERFPRRADPIERLGFEEGKAFLKALDFARKKEISLNFPILLYFLLEIRNPKLNFILSRLLLSKDELKRYLKRKFKEERADIKKLLEDSLKYAKEKKKERIEVSDLIPKIAEMSKIFKEFLIQKKIKTEDLKNVAEWADYLEKEFTEAKKFWEWKNLIKKGALAREWTAGYTILLDRFSFDVTESMRSQKFRKIFAHQREVREMERILSGPEKNDVLIVGESGSGRRSMLESLARRCALGKSTPELNFKRIVFLDLPKLISITQTIEEAENLLDEIFREVVKAGNVILVIDDIHHYIGITPGRKVGEIEISGILSSYLPSPHFQLVGITTFEGLHRHIELRPSVLEYFEKIEVPEVSVEETLLILEDRALRLEEKYKVFFPLQTLKEIVKNCARYLAAIPFPEKAIDVIDESAISVSQKKKKIVLPKDVNEIITRKSKIPVGELEKTEKIKLLNLEKLLHERIIDQEEAVKEISAALRRARAELKVRKGPMGTFLFLGPTGVGKTETSKALSEIYFGSEERIIRLDMSEFQNVQDLPRLLGGEGKEGLLTTQVRENPFSLVLLDEFEKAHPNILNLFLQVFDEGHLTDGLGRKVDFKNTILIATSNAGYQLIFKATQEKRDWQQLKEELINYLVENGIFRPELLNRFDAVVLFKPLSKENLLKISELLLKKVKKNLKEKEIDFVITEELKEKIVQLSFDPKFGAREMQRVIQDKISNALAEALLSERIKRGNKIEIDPQTFQVKIIE